MAVKRQYVRGLDARAQKMAIYITRHESTMATVLDAPGTQLVSNLQAAAAAFTAYIAQNSPASGQAEQP